MLRILFLFVCLLDLVNAVKVLPNASLVERLPYRESKKAELKWCQELEQDPPQHSRCHDTDMFKRLSDNVHYFNTKKPAHEVLGHFAYHDGKPVFLSQHGIDWWLWHNHVRYMDKPGTYLDIGSNDPIVLSNSAVFDLCHGWRGICVDPNPTFLANTRSKRSCHVEPACISDDVHTEHSFALASMMDTRHTQGHTRFKNNKNGLPMKCKSLKQILSKLKIRHIDILFLDCEGCELDALASIDWRNTVVDIIVVEDYTGKVRKQLHKFQGYRLAAELEGKNFIFTGPGFTFHGQHHHRSGRRHLHFDDACLKYPKKDVPALLMETVSSFALKSIGGAMGWYDSRKLDYQEIYGKNDQQG